MKRSIAIAVMACAFMCAARAGLAQGAATDETGLDVQRLGRVVPGFAARLRGLEPDDTRAYFLLAEEVAAEANTDDEYELARQLFALSYELDRIGSGATTRRASACLALADLSTPRRDRRWLRAIARSLDPRLATPDWSAGGREGISATDAVDAATAIGAVRSGDGAWAWKLLKKDGVRRVFERYGGLITGAGPSEVLSLLETKAELWPCPECHNDRIVSERRDDKLVHRLCNTCNGSPGWEPTSELMLGVLRFETRVLDGVATSWSAQFAADQARPLRDPDPAEVAPAIGVRSDEPYWRDGRWRAEP